VGRFNVDSAPEGSLDAMLASAGLQIAAIDLGALPEKGKVANWFSEPRATKSIGAGYGEEFVANFLLKQVTPKNYDALLFVEKTTAVRPWDKAGVWFLNRTLFSNSKKRSPVLFEHRQRSFGEWINRRAPRNHSAESLFKICSTSL
jgi:hypothetical protein